MPLLANIYSSPSPLATQPASPPATEALRDIVTIKRLRRLERHQRTFVVANILLVLKKCFLVVPYGREIGKYRGFGKPKGRLRKENLSGFGGAGCVAAGVA